MCRKEVKTVRFQIAVAKEVETEVKREDNPKPSRVCYCAQSVLLTDVSQLPFQWKEGTDV